MTLEELLNKLIEKGWKPFEKEYDRFIIEGSGDMCFRAKYSNAKGDNAYDYYYEYFLIRQLVSKESGLWQFVCENGMLKKEGEYRAKRRHCHGWEHDEDFYHDISYVKKHDYEYRLIESALKDESELEEFLLSNIKVE